MKTLTLAILLSVALFAQDHESKFTVQKIDAAQVQKLAHDNADVDAAMKAFLAAQETLAKATEARNKTTASIKSQANLFESDCMYPEQPAGGGYRLPKPKQWRRAEIRGEYLLVSDGSTECYGFGTMLTGSGTTTLTLGNDSISTDTKPGDGFR